MGGQLYGNFLPGLTFYLYSAGLRAIQRKQLIDELKEDVYQLQVAVETLKQYHQDDNVDDDGDDKNDERVDEKGDQGKDDDAKPDDDAG